MSKRFMVRVISFCLSGFFIAGGIATMGWNRAFKYRQAIEYSYQRAFSELVSSMSNIDFTLQKGIYSGSPVLLASLSSDVFRESASASAALSQLPFSDLRLTQTAKFISQVGDYAYALSKRAAARKSLNDEDRDILTKLSATATSLSQTLNNLSNEIHDSDLKFYEVLKAEKDLDKAENGKIQSNIAGSFLNLEQQFPEFPTLIYDGPFSEHITKRKPAYLEGKSQVSKDTAKTNAAKFLGISANLVEDDGETADKNIPVYSFRCKRNGEYTYIDVTKSGGYILRLIDSRNVVNAKMTPVQAVKKAKEFLKAKGFGEMRESYWTRYNNIAVINFAAVSNNVILYPDLIKVSIALDNGMVCNFESNGYIMNHKPRKLPAAKVSESEARLKIAKDLKILSHDLALIPTEGQYEVLTHEFKCEMRDKKHCLVYVDAQTGDEVRIMILQEDENGTLAM